MSGARRSPGAGEHQGLALRLRGVGKVFDAEGLNVTALNGISLDIPYHRFSVIIGPSGSGKTTLLNLMGCIDRASSGVVEACGQDVGTLDDDALSDFRAAHIGFIFQHFSLVPVLSAYENVEHPLLLLGMGAAERRERAMAMLEAVDLADQCRHRPNQLSGGQKQRVAIARALVKEPAIILADEPTANLDSRTGDSIIALMRRMQAANAATFIFSTHDPNLIRHAEEKFVIRDGQLVERHSLDSAP
ncbi:MAG TPA: ABC transporter ATP-binding protein [Magnetospirillum sp.]|nr:ABC transporter ATP-binding protein [Magnetospirillum sp.]